METLQFSEDEKIIGIKGQVDKNDRLVAFSFISFKNRAAERRQLETIVSVAGFNSNNSEKFLLFDWLFHSQAKIEF